MSGTVFLARHQSPVGDDEKEEHVQELTLGIDVACRAAHQASLADVAGRFAWSGRRFGTTTADLDRLWVAIGGSVNIVPDGDGSIQVSRPDGDIYGDSPDSGSPLVRWRGIATASSNNDLMVVRAYCAS